MTRSEHDCRSGRTSKWIRPAKRLAIYLRDGMRCVYCNRDLRRLPKSKVGLDHLRPQVRNGGNHESNLVTCCSTCNSARKSRRWRTFADDDAKARIERLVRRSLNMELAKAILDGYEPWPWG